MIVMRSGLPAAYANGRYRQLGLRLTDNPRPKIASFRDFLAGNPVLDLARLGSYQSRFASIPVFDQGDQGDCVDNSLVRAVMKARVLAGMTPFMFSPSALYALTNGGVDKGSDPRDAIKAWQETGLCLASDVPPSTWVLAADLTASVLATAARFRGDARSVYQCDSFAELVTADELGFSTTFTIRVGDNFGPGPDGVVGFSPGPGNHQLCGGDRFEAGGAEPYFWFDNSWAAGWGMDGRAKIAARHVEQQPGALMFAYRWAGSDPLDPTNPT